MSSCSDNSYRQSIPKNSIALVSFDANKISGVNNATLLKAFLKIKNVDNCGIDLTQKIYLFESPDGNIGICAKVNSTSKLEEMLQKTGSKPTKFRDAFFTPVGNSWLAGYNSQSLLLIGPIAIARQEEVKAQMAKYLKQDEEKSILVSPIYLKLDSLESPIAMVAQAQAFPEQFIAPMMLGAPKNANPNDVLISAKMNIKNGCWEIAGRPFSLNKRINYQIEQSLKVYRPIKGKYIQSMPNTSLFGMFVNVDGNKFLPILQNNKQMQVLLTGVNQAIDLDNIIRSVNGDMCIKIPQYTKNCFNLSMAAQLTHSKWLADVDYWKQSVPQGGKIIDWGKNAYAYTNGNTSFLFGVTSDLQFFSGNSKEMALNSIKVSAKPIDKYVQNKIKGEKMVMVINMDGVDNKMLKMFQRLLKPVFGNVHTIIYKLD